MIDTFVQFSGLVLFGFLFSVQRNYVSTSLVFLVWNLIGTVLHEASHYLVSLILNGKPKLPNLIPKRYVFYEKGVKYSYWLLGYVENRNINSFNAFFIGFAPVLVLFPLAFYVYLNFFNWFEYSYKNLFLFYLVLFVILYNALPSKTDIKVAFKGLTGLVVFILTLLLGITIYQGVINHETS